MWVDNAHASRQRLLFRNLNAKHEILPYELLTNEVPEISKKTLQIWPETLVTPLDSRALLLRTPHTLEV